jgi:hypothetical protein
LILEGSHFSADSLQLLLGQLEAAQFLVEVAGELQGLDALESASILFETTEFSSDFIEGTACRVFGRDPGFGCDDF